MAVGVLSPATVHIDMQDAGRYRVYGVVTLSPAVPLRRRVRLHDQRSGRFIRETWSDATTGAYSFDCIRGGAGQLYYVTTFDHTGEKQAVIADGVVPEAM